MPSCRLHSITCIQLVHWKETMAAPLMPIYASENAWMCSTDAAWRNGTHTSIVCSWIFGRIFCLCRRFVCQLAKYSPLRQSNRNWNCNMLMRLTCVELALSRQESSLWPVIIVRNFAFRKKCALLLCQPSCRPSANFNLRMKTTKKDAMLKTATALVYRQI